MDTQQSFPAKENILSALLGTAVGDSLGLPAEKLTPKRIRKLWGKLDRHHFFFGRGLISDDTEHTLMVGQAWLAHPADPGRFGKTLAWKLRWWFVGLPAGVGLATARACIKLWLGWGHEKSGVYSAGNGPAMRAAILGTLLHDDFDLLRKYVRVSTRITHTDPRAEIGAFAIAAAAAMGANCVDAEIEPFGFLARLRERIPDADAEFLAQLDLVESHLRLGHTCDEFATETGSERGVSGYIYRTVPAVLFCFLKHPSDFRSAMIDMLSLGGDTDTTAAILGGVAGATNGVNGIPPEWIDGICEWPRSVSWMKRLAEQLERRFGGNQTVAQIPLFWPGQLLRNLFFLGVVLAHGFRRLAPPY